MMRNDLRDISRELPNGFHDAELGKIEIDYVSRTITMEMHLWVGDMDQEGELREAYRKGTLTVEDFAYCVIEPPDPCSEFTGNGTIGIDGGEYGVESAPSPPLDPNHIPSDMFLYWFYVQSWNSFVHLCARRARIALA
jgi:hypothetical protein